MMNAAVVQDDNTIFTERIELRSLQQVSIQTCEIHRRRPHQMNLKKLHKPLFDYTTFKDIERDNSIDRKRRKD